MLLSRISELIRLQPDQAEPTFEHSEHDISRDTSSEGAGLQSAENSDIDCISLISNQENFLNIFYFYHYNVSLVYSYIIIDV